MFGAHRESLKPFADSLKSLHVITAVVRNTIYVEAAASQRTRTRQLHDAGLLDSSQPFMDIISGTGYNIQRRGIFPPTTSVPSPNQAVPMYQTRQPGFEGISILPRLHGTR